MSVFWIDHDQLKDDEAVTGGTVCPNDSPARTLGQQRGQVWGTRQETPLLAPGLL